MLLFSTEPSLTYFACHETFNKYQHVYTYNFSFYKIFLFIYYIAFRLVFLIYELNYFFRILNVYEKNLTSYERQ